MDTQPYLDFMMQIKGSTPATIKSYSSDLKIIFDHLLEQGVTTPQQVDQHVVAGLVTWMRSQRHGRGGKEGLADASIARRMAVLSSCLKWAQTALDPKIQNPVENLPFRWKKDRTPKPVDEDSLDLLLASIDNLRDKTLFYLLVASGLRVAEVHQLNRDSIQIEMSIDDDGKEDFVGVGEVVGKGGKRRKFYVAGYALTLIAQHLRTRSDSNPALFLSRRNQRLSVRTIQHTLGALCEKLGYDHINVHRLRHTYATRLANANINSLELMALMGHNSFATTMQYFKLTDKTVARGYFSAMQFTNG